MKKLGKFVTSIIVLSALLISSLMPAAAATAAENDSAYLLVSKTYTNSNGSSYTYTYTYDSYGNVLTEIRENSDGSSISYTYTYDSYGNVLTEIYEYSDGSSKSYTYSYTYTYDSYGNVLTEICEHSDDYSYSYTYTYDSSGNVLTEIYENSDGSSESYTYTYDSYGNVLTEINEYTYGNGSCFSASYSYTYTYDSYGNVLTYTYEDSSYTSLTTYTYDSFGNMLTYTCVAGDDYSWSSTYTYTYTYDSSGNMLTKTYESEYVNYGEDYEYGYKYSDMYTWTYDSAGNLLTETYESEEIEYSDDYEWIEEYSYSCTCTYDSSGNKLNETYINNNNYSWSYTWTYDSAGNLLTEIYESSSGYTESYTYIYSFSGDVRTEISESDIELSYTSCTYDGDSKEPAVTVTVNNTVLTEDEDYTVTYSNNTDVGTATVTVAGTGSYSGTVSVQFEIVCSHSYIGSVTTAATCETDGVMTYTCELCGDTYTETIPAAHTWSTVSVSAGSYGSTKTTYTCSVCGDEKTVTSLYGSDRYETAEDIVASTFESCTYAVIADGSNFPDALAAASLAGALDAPILITSDSRIQDTIEELESLGVTNVYIVGGTSSVSAGAMSAIEAEGIEVKRIAGDTRQLTAVAVAEEVLSITGEQDVCLVATGKTYADALAASPYAYWSASPIYLTKNDGSISDEVLASIKEAGYSQIIIIGGTSSVTEATEEALSEIASVTRLGGSTRYETAAEIAEWSVAQGMSYDGLTVATGTNYPDALTASALCGKNGSVLLLSAASASSSSVLEEVVAENAESISDVYIVGGYSSVSEEVREMIVDALG